MAGYKGIEYLRRKLNQKAYRVCLRYKYYEMKNAVKDFNISTPPGLRNWKSVLGWCGKAVDSLSDRLVFREFSEDNFDLNEISLMNNADVLYDSAVLSALIASCCFIYICPDDVGYPRMQVIDGKNATGVIDTITGLLIEGYAVLERDDNNNPTLEAYFVAGRTDYYQKGEKNVKSFHNRAPYPLLVPIIYRPDAVGQFAQQSMSPHMEQLRMFAALFAGETGLTMDDLDFVSENPSSSEAIKASHENLRLTARKAQRTFGSGFLNAGYLAACLRDGYPYERRQFYLTKPKWEPVFEADAAALSSYGDGAIKINQAIPEHIDGEKFRDITGI
ncbi:MAG: hypothetical protein ACI4DW_07715 [Lachnospiraceae bacterium]